MLLSFAATRSYHVTQHLDGNVGHRHQRAPGAGQHLAHAGDVLDHAAARLWSRHASHRRAAEEVIARGAGLEAARAGQLVAIAPSSMPGPDSAPSSGP